MTLGGSSSRRAPQQPRPHRADIEGLRALAVAIVFSSHLVQQPQGGFVGIDVFFVISGFLITGALIRELENTNTVSVREFYARRVRRLLPAALATLLAACIAARLVFSDARTTQTFQDSLWAAFSLANWHMAMNRADYGSSAPLPSLVEHFWPLSLAEQFYVVWLALIVTVVAMSRRRGTGSIGVALAATLGLAVTMSLAWSFWQTPTDPTTAYFSTLARGWEIGVGGLLALVTARLSKAPKAVSAILVWGGLITIVAAALMTQADSSFPAPGALPATLGAVAVIAGGTASAAPRNHVLDNPAAQFLGRISYSLYLWHWPVILVSEAIMMKGSPAQLATAIIATFALATASFYFIERPIRNTTLLSDPTPGNPARPLSARARRGYGVALAGAATLAMVVALVPERVAGAQVAPAWPSARPSPSTTASPGPSSDQLGDQIESAVRATTWPTLNPPVNRLSRSRAAEWDRCADVGPEQQGMCRFGSSGAKRTVVVLGDTIAVSWLPAIRAGFEAKGWMVRGLTLGECPAARIDVVSSRRDKGFTEHCRAHQRFALARAKALKPALIIISTSSGTLSRIVDAHGSRAAAAFQAAQTSALGSLVSKTTKVVVLAPPPSRQDLRTCATRPASVPADCLSDLLSSWEEFRRIETEAAAQASAVYVDTQTWTCASDGVCPAFIGSTPVMTDGIHLTDAMSRRLGELLYRTATR